MQTPLQNQKSFTRLLIILCVALAAVGYLWWNFYGMYGSDDLVYSSFANSMAHGHFGIPNASWPTRIGIIFPMAVLYSILGVSDFANTIVPGLSIIGCFFLLCWFSWKHFGGKIQAWIIPFIFLFATPALIQFGTEALGHVPALFLYTAANILILTGSRQQYWKFAAAGLLIGGAYLMHELTIVVAPTAVILMLYRLRKGELGWRDFGVFLVGALFIPLAEAIIYYRLTGNPFYRLSLAQNNPLNDPINRRTILDTIQRIVYLRWVTILTSPGLGVAVITALAIALARWRLIWKHPVGRILLLWLFSQAIVLAVMTTSLKSYNVLHLYDEFQFSILPPLYLLASLVLLENGSESDSPISPLGLLLMLIPSYSILRGNGSGIHVYLILIAPAVVFIAFKLAPRLPQSILIRNLAVLIPLLAGALIFSFHKPGTNMLQAERTLLDQWQSQGFTSPIWTDTRSANVLDFYARFDPTFEVKPLSDLSDGETKGVVLINWYWLNILKDRSNIPIPKQALSPQDSWCLVENVPAQYQIRKLGGCVKSGS